MDRPICNTHKDTVKYNSNAEVMVASNIHKRAWPVRWLWFALGVLALAAGAVGVVLPVVPTTPFVILAAVCFGKCSPRLHGWLVNNRVFGPVIADWHANGSIAPRYKTTALAMMGAALTASFLAGFAPIVLAIQSAAILLAASYILTRPNHPPR